MWTETSCENGTIYNSTCYKIHREPVNWFTAVNRCLSNNGSLAVFDDHVHSYFATSLLVDGPLWIGLIKSWWTWPDAGLPCMVISIGIQLQYGIWYFRRGAENARMENGGTDFWRKAGRKRGKVDYVNVSRGVVTKLHEWHRAALVFSADNI